MTFKTLFEILNVISPIALFTGLLIGIYYYKKVDIIHKGITGYLLAMLCVDMSGRVLEYYSRNNLIVLPVYSLIEMGMFVYFYFRYLFKRPHRALILLSILAAVYIIWELISFSRDVRQFQSYAKVADNFVIITLALVFLNDKIRDYKESRLDNFYLNAVILIFFSVNLIFFLPLNFTLNETTGFYFWLFNLTTTVSFYMYLIYSVWKNGRLKKPALQKKITL